LRCIGAIRKMNIFITSLTIIFSLIELTVSLTNCLLIPVCQVSWCMVCFKVISEVAEFDIDMKFYFRSILRMESKPIVRLTRIVSLRNTTTQIN